MDKIKQLKVVMVGDGFVGKTPLCSVLAGKDFPSRSVATHAFLESYIVNHMFEDKEFEVAYWDTGGVEDYDRVRPLAYPNTEVFVIVFDITNLTSLTNIATKWLPELKIFDKRNSVKLLVGHKCDLISQREVSYEIAQEFANENGFTYIEASALTGYNIEKLSKCIIEDFLTKPQKVKNNRKSLQKSLDKAKKHNETIPVRFLKLFFTGSGAAGKTSFINLLLKRKFNEHHHSTNVVHTNHAVSMSKATFHGSPNDEVEWVELNSSLELNYLHSVLLPHKTAPEPSTPSVTTSKHSNKDFTDSTVPTKPVESITINQHIPPVQKSSVKHWFTKHLTSSVKGSSLSTFNKIANILPNPDAVVHQPGEILNIITLLDTGGQPEYIHLLPTINIYPSVTFVVHDLSKSLSDQVLVEYSQHGKHKFKPYPLNYTNLDMIKLLMSAANDAVEKPITSIPKLVTTPGSNSKSYICLVGTHADKVTEQKVEEVENELSTLVNITNCETAIWQNEKEKILFSVNNTTAGQKDDEDPVAKLIRMKIETLAEKKEVYNLPITWMLLQLEIQQLCSKREKAYISFQDCVALAKETSLMSKEKEIKSVLLYHHLLGVLIYFDEVPGLCDYVIVDHQWWFDKLSNIISITFHQASLDHQAIRKLKYQGLLSKELLQHVEWKDDIKEEFFLTLLVQMRIIAPVFTQKDKIEEYFIPYVLPNYDLQNSKAILDQYGYIQGEPLLVQFHSGLLPRGLFCCLIVELLQRSPKCWEPRITCEETHHTFNNLITFILPTTYSLSLLDKVSYLELQIRHLDKVDCPFPIHVEVYNYLVYALTEVCIHLNFDYERLQYGFMCKCGKKPDHHIAVASVLTMSSEVPYARCTVDNAHQFKMNPSQLIWFHLKQIHIDYGPHGGVIQRVKDHYNDLINLNTTAMLPTLYAKGVITLEDKETISLTKPLERDKMQYLLDRVIMPSLQAGVIQKFNLLVEVMEGSEDVVTRKVVQQLATDGIKPSSPSGDHVIVDSLTEGNPDQPAFKRPAMRLLHEIVVPRIAADWSIVADYLEYEVGYKKAIKERCDNDSERCCVELFEDWLSSDRGVSPKSWSRLIEVLKGIRSLTSTTEKIIQDLANAGVVVTK